MATCLLIPQTISPSHSSCFVLPTTSTPIQNGKDGEMADFNIDCVSCVILISMYVCM